MRCENPIGEPFFELSEVDSSNNYAMQMAQAQMAVHGTTWFAHFQKAGKGQRGKLWNATASQNIMLSCLLQPESLSVDSQVILNVAVALACFDFFSGHAGEETCIKWPNDIYWRDRKAGGILIENILKGEKWKYAVVGIGININQTLFPGNINNAVSIAQINGKTYNVIDLAKELCCHLEARWQQLLHEPPGALLAEYNSHLYKRDQSANFRKDKETFTGVVRGVTPLGEILIETWDRGTHAYPALEWLLP